MSRWYKNPNTTKFAGKTRASIEKSGVAGWFIVKTPWNENFLTDMKANIQQSSRQWDPVLKVWKISDMFLEDIIILLKLHFDDVVVDLEEEAPAIAVTTKPINVFDEVFRMIPDDQVERIYKALAFAVHPDHGGNTAQMTALNVSYQARKK